MVKLEKKVSTGYGKSYIKKLSVHGMYMYRMFYFRAGTNVKYFFFHTRQRSTELQHYGKYRENFIITFF